MLYQEIDETGHKTIYETNINDFIKSYRLNWKQATPEVRKAAKEYWIDIYRNAIFPESFHNAERMLAVISDLESDVSEQI